MTAPSAGQVVNAALAALAKRGRVTGRPRSERPVHRHSRHRGEREALFWRAVDPLELRAIAGAAKLHASATKQPGRRNGELGHVAIQVLEAMIEIVDWATGDLEPAYQYLAKKLRRSKDAIWRALKELRDEGFLEWIRRSEPTADGARQIENAYRIRVPARWAQRVAMQVAQWRRRAGKAGQLFRDRAADKAAREDRKAADRLANGRRFLTEVIADPEQRALAIAEMEGQSPSPPSG